LKYNYILISSKTAHNFDYVIHKVKTIKEKSKEEKVLRPKIFVVGNANVGKSSFINKLVQKSHKFLRENQRNKEFYKKNYEINEPTLMKQNSEGHANLTTSPLPGTTIGITKVEEMTMGVKLFDTPGIPNQFSMNFLMNNLSDIVSSTICHKILPHSLTMKQGYSIWIGGLGRIDFMNGEDKFFTFFFSHHVTIHRTPLLGSEEIFHKHVGKLLKPIITKNLEELKLKHQSFNLTCEKASIINYDICIPGLGWFSIAGKGFIQFDLYLPEGINAYLRKKPLMPYEIRNKGVHKYTGKTFNSKSKRNRI
jgi:ribosome biogenesis GTPase A